MAPEKLTTRVVKPLRSGQITIPAAFRQQLGIDETTLLQVTLDGDELRIRTIRPASSTVAGSPWLKDLYSAFAPVRAEVVASGLTESEVNALIDEAVAGARQQHA